MLVTELIAALQGLPMDAEVIVATGNDPGQARLHEVDPDSGYIDPLVVAELPEVIETSRDSYPIIPILSSGDTEARGVPLEAKVSIVIGIPGSHWQVDRTLTAEQLRRTDNEQWVLRAALQGMTGLITKTAGEAIADIEEATIVVEDRSVF